MIYTFPATVLLAFDLSKAIECSKSIISFILGNNFPAIILLVFTLIELLQSRKTRNAELLYHVFDDIHNSKLLFEIDWLEKYQKDGLPIDYSDISTEDRRRMDMIVDTFTRISYLAQKKAISQKHILSMYSGLFIRVWRVTKVYIISKREKTGLQNYACYFEDMANKAKSFRKKRKIGTRIKKDIDS